MKRIPLTQGKFALVDDEDFEYLSQWKWHVTNTIGMPHGYARRTGSVYMHRVITKAPNEKVVDHKNGNTLDNRKQNLRVCTDGGNQANRNKVNVNNTSGISNVYFSKDKNRIKRWRAIVKRNYRKINLGSYLTKQEASEAVEKYLAEEPICLK